MWASFINPHDICYFPYQDKESAQGYVLKLHEKYLDKLHRQFPDTPLPPLPDNFEPSGDEVEWVRAHQEGKIDNSGLNQAYGSSACRWSDEFWQEYRWAYRRYMEIVDEEIGILLQGLKDAGLEENTIIVFTSDHGDHDGAHKLTMKRSFYEESANIPLIVAGNRGCATGTVDSTTLVNNGVDLIPTLCDLAGIEPPEELRGVSFRPAAEGKPLARDFVVSETNTGRMLRTAKYKYTVYHIKGQSDEQLFDMQNDRGEMVNLAKKAEFADILKEHREKLQAWVVENNDTKGKKYLAEL
jgi:arylsulfatase A-like enzyme